MFSSPRAFSASFHASTIQANSRAAGAAMDALRKCDARNLPSTRRKKIEHSFRQLSQAYITNSAAIKQDGTQTNRRTFAEDFMMEHSNFGQSIALAGIAARHGTVPKKLQPSAQSFGFPS